MFGTEGYRVPSHAEDRRGVKNFAGLSVEPQYAVSAAAEIVRHAGEPIARNTGGARWNRRRRTGKTEERGLPVFTNCTCYSSDFSVRYGPSGNRQRANT